ncbi:MAG: NUDIX hydrolase [Chloroflexi bacterium]|nr:NUDIX hydrolase [Chloroflexota bacterium]
MQAIVVRGDKVLMVKHRQGGQEHWCLPGGGLQPGETPEQGALRELREECSVTGVVLRQTAHVLYADDVEAYSFHVEIGDQTPSLGTDPEVPIERAVLVDMRWLRLAEIPERNRVYLWGAGLLGVGDFAAEVESWGNDLSYPGKEHGSA